MLRLHRPRFYHELLDFYGPKHIRIRIEMIGDQDTHVRVKHLFAAHISRIYKRTTQGGGESAPVSLMLMLFALRAIFCKSHPICDSRVFKICSYFNQLKIKVILEYGRNLGFTKHFVEFLGGGGGGGVERQQQFFKKCNQCPQAIF